MVPGSRLNDIIYTNINSFLFLQKQVIHFMSRKDQNLIFEIRLIFYSKQSHHA